MLVVAPRRSDPLADGLDGRHLDRYTNVLCLQNMHSCLQVLPAHITLQRIDKLTGEHESAALQEWLLCEEPSSAGCLSATPTQRLTSHGQELRHDVVKERLQIETGWHALVPLLL